MQAALTTLGGTYLFQQMKAAHEQVQSIRLQEGAEQSEKVTGALVAARKACDEIYDKITYLIEAYTLTADNPAPYDAFITLWNGTLKIYQDILDRKSGSTGSSGTGSGSGENQNNQTEPGTDPGTGGGTDPGTGGGETPDPGTDPTPDPGTGGGTNPDDPDEGMDG